MRASAIDSQRCGSWRWLFVFPEVTARRFGKNVEATRVHHIWPVEEFPEYAWCRWNLIALSLEAHMKMHVPGGRGLSELGEQLRRRTIPPDRR